MDVSKLSVIGVLLFILARLKHLLAAKESAIQMEKNGKGIILEHLTSIAERTNFFAERKVSIGA